jgi:hypothetical protein
MIIKEPATLIETHGNSLEELTSAIKEIASASTAHDLFFDLQSLAVYSIQHSQHRDWFPTFMTFIIKKIASLYNEIMSDLLREHSEENRPEQQEEFILKYLPQDEWVGLLQDCLLTNRLLAQQLGPLLTINDKDPFIILLTHVILTGTPSKTISSIISQYIKLTQSNQRIYLSEFMGSKFVQEVLNNPDPLIQEVLLDTTIQYFLYLSIIVDKEYPNLHRFYEKMIQTIFRMQEKLYTESDYPEYWIQCNLPERQFSVMPNVASQILAYALISNQTALAQTVYTAYINPARSLNASELWISDACSAPIILNRLITFQLNQPADSLLISMSPYQNARLSLPKNYSIKIAEHRETIQLREEYLWHCFKKHIEVLYLNRPHIFAAYQNLIMQFQRAFNAIPDLQLTSEEIDDLISTFKKSNLEELNDIIPVEESSAAVLDGIEEDQQDADDDSLSHISSRFSSSSSSIIQFNYSNDAALPKLEFILAAIGQYRLNRGEPDFLLGKQMESERSTPSSPEVILERYEKAIAHGHPEALERWLQLRLTHKNADTADHIQGVLTTSLSKYVDGDEAFYAKIYNMLQIAEFHPQAVAWLIQLVELKGQTFDSYSRDRDFKTMPLFATCLAILEQTSTDKLFDIEPLINALFLIYIRNRVYFYIKVLELPTAFLLTADISALKTLLYEHGNAQVNRKILDLFDLRLQLLKLKPPKKEITAEIFLKDPLISAIIHMLFPSYLSDQTTLLRYHIIETYEQFPLSHQHLALLPKTFFEDAAKKLTRNNTDVNDNGFNTSLFIFYTLASKNYQLINDESLFRKIKEEQFLDACAKNESIFEIIIEIIGSYSVDEQSFFTSKLMDFLCKTPNIVNALSNFMITKLAQKNSNKKLSADEFKALPVVKLVLENLEHTNTSYVHNSRLDLVLEIVAVLYYALTPSAERGQRFSIGFYRSLFKQFIRNISEPYYYYASRLSYGDRTYCLYFTESELITFIYHALLAQESFLCIDAYKIYQQSEDQTPPKALSTICMELWEHADFADNPYLLNQLLKFQLANDVLIDFPRPEHDRTDAETLKPIIDKYRFLHAKLMNGTVTLYTELLLKSAEALINSYRSVFSYVRNDSFSQSVPFLKRLKKMFDDAEGIKIEDKLLNTFFTEFTDTVIPDSAAKQQILLVFQIITGTLNSLYKVELTYSEEYQRYFLRRDKLTFMPATERTDAYPKDSIDDSIEDAPAIDLGPPRRERELAFIK